MALNTSAFVDGVMNGVHYILNPPRKCALRPQRARKIIKQRAYMRENTMSDQRLCYSLSAKFDSLTSEMRNFN